MRFDRALIKTYNLFCIGRYIMTIESRVLSVKLEHLKSTYCSTCLTYNIFELFKDTFSKDCVTKLKGSLGTFEFEIKLLEEYEDDSESLRASSKRVKVLTDIISATMETILTPEEVLGVFSTVRQKDIMEWIGSEIFEVSVSDGEEVRTLILNSQKKEPSMLMIAQALNGMMPEIQDSPNVLEHLSSIPRFFNQLKVLKVPEGGYAGSS